MLLRTLGEIDRDNVVVVSAGVAFFALFASVPALVALVSVYGLVSTPEVVAEQVAAALPMLPAEARALMEQALEQAVAQSRGTLSAGALTGIGVSIWTASRGTRALLRAIDIAYDEDQKRGLIRGNAMAYAFTLGVIVSAIVSFSSVVVLPMMLQSLGMASVGALVAAYVRWPLLFTFVSGSLAILYRYGASRRPPKWRWVWVGAVTATTLWLLSSMVMSAYLSSMLMRSAAYGQLGAVLILLLWLYVSSFVVVMGAELNAELEHQTRVDTTVGPERPMGERGAHVADNLGACRTFPRWRGSSGTPRI